MNHQLRTGLSTVPEMDDTQFVRWQGLLEERTGMCLAPQRRSFLQTSLGLRMREVGCDSIRNTTTVSSMALPVLSSGVLWLTA